jgi:aromatic ring hydroxylase
MDSVEALWADFANPVVTADDYINSLRGRRMNVFFMGERVAEPADHPVIRPSINAMAETYRVASERPELGTVHSDIARLRVNRFLHVPTRPDDLVAKHEMQRELGRRTGTCFQRCVGLDAIGTCHSVTFDIDAKGLHGAGSPQAQRIQIARGMKLDDKKARARALAGLSERANRPVGKTQRPGSSVPAPPSRDD